MRVIIQIAAPREGKVALRAALRAAAGGQADGPWTACLRPALLYRNPGEGIWWWTVLLTSPASRTHALLIAPEEQTPAGVAEAVQQALSGARFTVICASCGLLRIDADAWVRRERIKEQGRLSHALCPECLPKLYPPDLVQRARTRATRRAGGSTS